MKKSMIFTFTTLFFLTFSSCSAQTEPKELSIMKKAYSDVSFKTSYDKNTEDWFIEAESDGKKAEFFWCDGKLIPPEKLSEKENYWGMMYRYSKEIPDPKNFTEEDVERIRNFSSPANRRSGKSSPQFFYDFIYDCHTRADVEKHITQVSFLGKTSNIHERIKIPLEKVEAEILKTAETDEEVKNFAETLASADSYNWREISDSGNRSFHSMGIAVDVLPRGWGQKNIYWAWRRDIDPDNWMLLPLERRWMPPLKVIEIFESFGFIWGGKWTIWDNMHFEYRPEVILYSFGDLK